MELTVQSSGPKRKVLLYFHRSPSVKSCSYYVFCIEENLISTSIISLVKLPKYVYIYLRLINEFYMRQLKQMLQFYRFVV